MSAIPLSLADAVTTVLNAEKASFTSLTAGERSALTVRRSYPDWEKEFESLRDLAIDVVFVSSGDNGGDLVSLDADSFLTTDPAIDVAVRYRFAATDRESDGRFKNTSVDRFVSLIEDIHEILAGERMQALPIANANWVDAKVRTYCDYKRLREGFFLGVVRVFYTVSKEI